MAIKCTYFPRYSNKNQYWTSLAIYNCRDYDTHILLKRVGPGLSLKNYYEIKSRDRFVMDNTKLNEVESLVVYYTDEIAIASYLGTENSLVNTERTDFTNLRQMVFGKSTRPRDMGADTAFYKYYGKNSCSELPEYVVEIFKLIFMDVYYRFPNRKSGKICIGDMSNRTGNCDGHPNATHGWGKSMDLDYYTFNENKTQYGRPAEDLFDGDVLDTNVFDTERNLYLMEKILDIFPDSSIRTDIRMKNDMEEYAEKEYNRIVGDSPGKYNHDRHMHINLDYNHNIAVNWEYNL